MCDYSAPSTDQYVKKVKVVRLTVDMTECTMRE